VILDEPMRGTFTYLEYPGILTLPGLEQMRRFQRRELPYGPLWYLIGLDIVEFGVGTATFRMPCTRWLQSPSGVIPGGVLALVGDGALAGAIQTTLAPKRLLATSDLALTFIRPPGRDCEAIIARAQLIEAGSAQALSEATIEDSVGHLLARAATRCVIVDVPGPLPEPPDGPVAWPEYPDPNPFQRPPEGTILPKESWDSRDGIEMLRDWEAGTLPRSPLSNLLSAKVEQIREGSITCTIPATPWLCSLSGSFYGGALGLLADYAMHGAVQSVLPAGTAWATLDLKIRFLQPITPDGRPLAARARVVHLGRRIAVAGAEISTADGRLAALADASVMLLPHRSWDEIVALTDESHDVGVAPPNP
jgi:uncharacterized protein (TIGR00369 family)